jgi:alpha,alpha-trehalase
MSTSFILQSKIPQAGFGWTNGVVLWMASKYGNILVLPKCPDLLDVPQSSNKNASKGLLRQISVAAVFSLSITLAFIFSM